MDWFDLAMTVRPFFMVWIALAVTGLLIWYCRPGRGRLHDRHSRIPFTDDHA